MIAESKTQEIKNSSGSTTIDLEDKKTT